MTVLLAIVLYVTVLFVVLLLVGGVRRGDALNSRSLRSMRNAPLDPMETPRLLVDPMKLEARPPRRFRAATAPSSR
jgi:hypothetical protein